MHNRAVETTGKCRRLFYAKVDAPPDFMAGDVLGVASDGGVLAEFKGDNLIIATFNDPTAPNRIGCVEAYYNPMPAPGKTLKPVSIDLTKVQSCCGAVDAYRAAEQEMADFILECSVECGSECSKESDMRHTLKVAEIQTRGDSTAHDRIVAKQAELEACCSKCETCCDELLATRDAAVTYADVVTPSE